MATQEHKRLAMVIKECHDSLRQLRKRIGVQRAWEDRLKNTSRLQEYAEAMRQLASIWERNSTRADLLAHSRVQWVIDYCAAYFSTDHIYLAKRRSEPNLLESWIGCDILNCNYLKPITQNMIRVLDVGSCFNPFIQAPSFAVTAIDLHPAAPDVIQGDFLRVEIVDAHTENPCFCDKNGELQNLPRTFFHCVIFSLLLEYMPTSDLRLKCCRKAYELLSFEGILVIITPDSQHVGKNASLMKNWRYTLGTLGFFRVCFEKLPHITCMVFRKTCHPYVSQRWSELHHEDYMRIAIEIPQDTKQFQLGSS